MGEHIIYIPNCACGERMTVSRAHDAFVCLNCDGVQPQEVSRKPGAGPRARNTTPQDHAYNSEMRRREKQWYPGQRLGAIENRKG